MGAQPSKRDIESVVRRHEAEVLSLPGVARIGVGVDRGREVIIIFVKRGALASDANLRSSLPRQIEGFATDVREELIVGSGAVPRGDPE